MKDANKEWYKGESETNEIAIRRTDDDECVAVVCDLGENEEMTINAEIIVNAPEMEQKVLDLTECLESMIEISEAIIQRQAVCSNLVDAINALYNEKEHAKAVLEGKKKKKYSVCVGRNSYKSRSFEVEANSQEEAEEIAIDKASDHDFTRESEDDCEYNVLTCEEKE